MLVSKHQIGWILISSIYLVWFFWFDSIQIQAACPKYEELLHQFDLLFLSIEMNWIWVVAILAQFYEHFHDKGFQSFGNMVLSSIFSCVLF